MANISKYKSLPFVQMVLTPMADGRKMSCIPLRKKMRNRNVLVYGIVNMAVDISYAWFDPRVRLGESAQ